MNFLDFLVIFIAISTSVAVGFALATMSHKKVSFEEKCQIAEDIYKSMDDDKLRRVYVNYPIGTKIISQSNEPSPVLVGTVTDYITIKKSVLLQVTDDTGRVFHLLNRPAYWTKQREYALGKLNWAERYTVMCKFDEITEDERKRKESQAYQVGGM